MKWISFIHIYQPPTSDKERIMSVAKESYQFIVDVLKKNPDFKLTININACLTEQLAKFGYEDLLNDIKALLEKGQIELVESGAYHPILAMLPEKEIERQIQINKAINSKHFGEAYAPKGFYIPEMAYTEKVAKIIKAMGYEWVILDEINYNGKLGQVKFNTKYQIKNVGLNVVFRNRSISQSYVPDTILKLIKSSNAPEIVITATDGEIYGHKHKDIDGNLTKVAQTKEVGTQTVSEYLSELQEVEEVKLVDGSWESTEEEIKKKKPFMLWDDPKNKIHSKLWDLTTLAIETINKSAEDPNYGWARMHLDRGLASCTYWWASARDFKLFSALAWNPDEIEKGLEELIKSIRSLDKIDCKIKIKAEQIYVKIKHKIWEKHWRYYAKGICKK